MMLSDVCREHPVGGRMARRPYWLIGPGSRLPLRASVAGLGGCISWRPPASSLLPVNRLASHQTSRWFNQKVTKNGRFKLLQNCCWRDTTTYLHCIKASVGTSCRNLYTTNWKCHQITYATTNISIKFQALKTSRSGLLSKLTDRR